MAQLFALFPRLAATENVPTSAATPLYNCIAWAAGDMQRVWWPAPPPNAYWPDGVPREPTIAVFELAFERQGYSTCADGSAENDIEKIALFADQAGVPTHAARQLADGSWTSKLGREIDIQHTVDGLSGGYYGSIVRFMKRRRVI